MSRRLTSGLLAAYLLIALVAPLAVRAQHPSGAVVDVPAALLEAEAAAH